MKIVNLKTYRLLKEQKSEELVYRHRLMQLEKAELLQELLSYQEAYQKDPNDILATVRGQHLMEVLESRAELKELRELAQEFQHKLKVRYYSQMQQLTEEKC